MNVISMKKKLLAGEYPNEDLKNIHLKGKQVRYLAATVPCVKLHNKNAYHYYFPKSKTYLRVRFYGGMGSYTTEGTMFKVDDNYDELFYEDGIRKYVTDDKEMPLIFNYTSYDNEIRQTVNNIESHMWLMKKPYQVRIEGYKSIHNKGWPKDSQFGREKTSLNIYDGDYETVYLLLEPIPTDYGHGSSLKQAILNGEYNGKEDPQKFKNRIIHEANEKEKAWKYRYEFERFIKESPIDKINAIIEDYNNDIAMYKKFLKMATKLRRMMKNNPGWFRKVKKVKKNHGMKNSVLFKEMLTLKATKETRRKTVNDEDNYQTQNLHWAIEKAVKE